MQTAPTQFVLMNRQEIVARAEALERWEVGETVAEALGTSDRPDPVLRPGGGPAGNARLTAWLGVVLLVLLAIEGITLIDIRGLISWHIVVGVLLIGPVLLKLASTGWRMVRYYAGSAAYRTAGAPPMPLRLLGPLVILSTLALLATGVTIALIGPESARGGLGGTPISPLFLHQASFAVWIVVTTVHVLGRLVPALRIVTGRAVGAVAVSGGLVRIGLIVLAGAAAVWLAVVILGDASAWQHEIFVHH